MKRIAVLTSGGDAPGINAAIRAVVRTSIARDWEVWGVRRGYAGLLHDDMDPIAIRDVSGVIERGGTVLGTSRAPEFREAEAQEKAIRNLRERGIDALVAIGGNGTQQGGHALWRRGFPVVGVASTIDNDLYGAEPTIGANTALMVALEAIDRLKVTAISHQRAFLVEVMGRDSGYLALMTAIAGAAEAVVIPEVETDPEDLADQLRDAYERGKGHAIVVVAEGAAFDAERLAAYFLQHHERLGFELRVTTLGHVQRGAAPTAFDRLMATRLGAGATERLAAGETGVLVGWLRGEVGATPLDEVVSKQKTLDPALIELAHVLSR